MHHEGSGMNLMKINVYTNTFNINIMSQLKEQIMELGAASKGEATRILSRGSIVYIYESLFNKGHLWAHHLLLPHMKKQHRFTLKPKKL